MATEQEMAKLSEYDFIVVIDKSGSMGTEDMKGRSRWDYMKETAESFARDMNKIDSDGLGMVLFSGASIEVHDGVSPEKVAEALRNNNPRGGTPLAEALTAALNLAGKSDKKDFLIVFTDGVPDDKTAAATVLRNQANKQANDDDCTVLFVQVGHDADASRYLKMLDDDLAGCKFDIVDAKTIDEAEKFATTADLVLAAIAD